MGFHLDEMMKDKKKKKASTIEKQLIPRLRFMGYLVTAFALIAFVWGVFLPLASPVDTPEEMELASGFTLFTSNGRLDAFGVAGIFAAVGAFCILVANRRKKA